MDEDDDWLSPPSQSQGGMTDPLVEQEYQRIASRYSDAGYREGITDGKLSTLQNGFDQGFALSVPPSRLLGRLRGRANALLAWMQQRPPFSPRSLREEYPGLMEEVRELAKDLSRVKRSDVLPWDEEKDAHEKEHEEGYELERTEGRDMEGVLNGMNGLGMQRELANGRLEEAMDDLESRLKDLEARVKASR